MLNSKINLSQLEPIIYLLIYQALSSFSVANSIKNTTCKKLNITILKPRKSFFSIN